MVIYVQHNFDLINSEDEGQVLSPSGRWTQWPAKVVVAGFPQRTGKFSQFRSVAVAHHDLCDMLPNRCLGLHWCVNELNHH